MIHSKSLSISNIPQLLIQKKVCQLVLTHPQYAWDKIYNNVRRQAVAKTRQKCTRPILPPVPLGCKFYHHGEYIHDFLE